MTRPRSGDDDFLVAALADGRTRAEVARFAGISERTVRRRLEDPQFAARVADARAERTNRATAALIGLLPKAIASLDAALDCDDMRVRLQAAQMAFKTSLVFKERLELEDRVRALEQGASAGGVQGIPVMEF